MWGDIPKRAGGFCLRLFLGHADVAQHVGRQAVEGEGRGEAGDERAAAAWRGEGGGENAVHGLPFDAGW
jgi:hypothetical protein